MWFCCEADKDEEQRPLWEDVGPEVPSTNDPLDLFRDVAHKSLIGTYSIRIRTDDWNQLGAHLDANSAGLMIRSVARGALKAHNVLASNVQYVYRRDFIVGINGKTGVQDMLDEIEMSQSLKLAMVHPKYILAHVDASELDLGIEVRRPKDIEDNVDSIVLEVINIKEDGAFHQYNMNCEYEGDDLQRGDFIFCINDVDGDVMRLFAELNKKEILKVHVLRVRGLPAASVK